MADDAELAAAEREAAWCQDYGDKYVALAKKVGPDNPNYKWWASDAEHYLAIATLLRRPAPPPAQDRIEAAHFAYVRAITAHSDERKAMAAAIVAASAAPPAHAELAARLRARAASMEDSDGMASDTSLLLNEAANALYPLPQEAPS